MYKTIPVTVREKIATAPKDATYVCGNSDFKILFDFDEEWNAHEFKTARFTYGGEYQDKIFSGSECPVPIISDVYSFKVGVFAGNLETTTPAFVNAKKSILCGGGLPADPPPDVYEQIMQRLNELEADVPPEQIAAAVEKYLQENPPEVETLPTVTEADDGKVLMVAGGAWTAGELPKYDGEYEIVPQAHGAVTLETAKKYMDANVTVTKIPYFETSNATGGETAYIASEVEIYGD